MKITVHKRLIPDSEPIRWQDLPGGTVVEFGPSLSSAIGLVYDESANKEKGMVILEGCSNIVIADGYLKCKITKVLGTLTECIVEEN